MSANNEVNQQKMTDKDEYFAKLAEWAKVVNGIHTANLMFLHHLCVTNPQFFQIPQPVTVEPPPPPPEVELPAEPNPSVFLLAPLSKRLAAEAIDRMIIGVLELVLTLVLSVIFFGYQSVNYLGLFNDLLLLNHVNEIPRSCLEALCCYFNGGVTPGKSLMNIRIVEGANIVPLEVPEDPPKVIIFEAQPPSLLTSLSRALVKNLLSMICLPLFILFAIETRRTAQNILTTTIVVENEPEEHI